VEGKGLVVHSKHHSALQELTGDDANVSDTKETDR
jgi:hypothetical protein